MSINICLICSQDITREGLGHIIAPGGFNIIESSDCVDNISCSPPDNDVLFVLDCPDSIEQSATVETLRNRFRSAKIVVLSDHFVVETMLDCFARGAQGYIIKSMKSARLLASLRLAALGEKVVPSDFVDAIGGQHGFDHAKSASAENAIEEVNLSPRELDVLCCLMAGYPNKIIARQLDVCEATVKVHVKAILRKLNVHNRTQAAIWANSRGLTESLVGT
jgi:two-component system nitrate/nitrite response regulator NarL